MLLFASVRILGQTEFHCVLELDVRPVEKLVTGPHSLLVRKCVEAVPTVALYESILGWVDGWVE